MTFIETIQANPGKSLLVLAAIFVVGFLIYKAMKKDDSDVIYTPTPVIPNPTDTVVTDTIPTVNRFLPMVQQRSSVPRMSSPAPAAPSGGGMGARTGASGGSGAIGRGR